MTARKRDKVEQAYDELLLENYGKAIELLEEALAEEDPKEGLMTVTACFGWGPLIQWLKGLFGRKNGK